MYPFLRGMKIIKKKIQINGFCWTVKTVKGDSKKMNPEPDCYIWGLTDYEKQTISIRKGMNWKRTRATITHELVHAFIDSYGYDPDTMSEESYCDFFASHARQIMYYGDQIYDDLLAEKEKEKRKRKKGGTHGKF